MGCILIIIALFLSHYISTADSLLRTLNIGKKVSVGKTISKLSANTVLHMASSFNDDYRNVSTVFPMSTWAWEKNPPKKFLTYEAQRKEASNFWLNIIDFSYWFLRSVLHI